MNLAPLYIGLWALAILATLGLAVLVVAYRHAATETVTSWETVEEALR